MDVTIQLQLCLHEQTQIVANLMLLFSSLFTSYHTVGCHLSAPLET